MTIEPKQAWIRSAAFDGTWILAPMFLPVAAVLLFRDYFAADPVMSLPIWLLLIVGIDVAHVYGTLHRSYWNAEARLRYGTLFRLVPLFCWVGGVVLFSLQPMLFWSTLAYLAVFHFVRQQYGFMRIYARRESDFSDWERRLDAAVIYLATIYPLVYWHCNLPRNFEWLISGDFVPGLPKIFQWIVGAVYLAALIAYAGKEFRRWWASGCFNFPKNFLIIGTALSWYIGIVVLNGDLAFTLTNVIAHGIPYTALVWSYGKKTKGKGFNWFTGFALPAFLLILIAFAYLEEGLWHAVVWRDKSELFPWFRLPQLKDAAWLALVVPALALPQATHYVLDGFLWRLRQGNSEVSVKLWNNDPAAEGGQA